MCHSMSTGMPATFSGRASACGSRFHSCSTAGATPPPDAAAAQAAACVGNTRTAVLGDAEVGEQPADVGQRVGAGRVDEPRLVAQRLQRRHAVDCSG